ncbi:hypothetical protein Agub_g6268, partial [Astrephomene gubernaculifera]
NSRCVARRPSTSLSRVHSGMAHAGALGRLQTAQRPTALKLYCFPSLAVQSYRVVEISRRRCRAKPSCAHASSLPASATLQTEPGTTASCSLYSRRKQLLALTAAAGLLAMAGPAKAGIPCPGLNGYALQQCLREVRRAREASERERQAGSSGTAGGSAAAGASSSSSVSDRDAVQEERLRYRQYEQPGTLVTLPNGTQYRELLEGSGPAATHGSVCEISYIVYRLSSGAYYKYSGGGTPVFLFSLGYGQEGKDDVGQTYRFRLDDPLALPAAVPPALLGMRQGGRRRVLVPPGLGWVDDKVGPRPDTFGGRRRLSGHRGEPLLLEVELVRVLGAVGPG